MTDVGECFLRNRDIEPKKTDKENWILRTDGVYQRHRGLVVFVDSLPEKWAYVKITRASRGGKAVFGKALPLCKCQQDYPYPDLRDCVCAEIEKPTAYVVICSDMDKCWSWAGHAATEKEAEGLARALCPFDPYSYTTGRANRFGVSARLWRDFHD